MAKTKAASAPKESPVKKAPTKSEIYATVAEETGLTKKQVGEVFDSLSGIIKKNLGARGPQQFSLPGLAKFVVKKKPATKARKGVSPFTGQEIVFKAKPASKTVKIRPLKALKDML